MSSAIIVASRYVIPSPDQMDEVFGTHSRELAEDGAGGAGREVILEDTTIVRTEFAGEPGRDSLARPGAVGHEDASSSRAAGCGASRGYKQAAPRNISFLTPVSAAP